MLQPVVHRKPGPERFPSRQIIVPSTRQFLEGKLPGWIPEAVGNTRHHPSIRRMARTTCVVTHVRRSSYVTA